MTKYILSESANKITYDAIGKVTEKELATAIHTPAIGGLGVALAQSAFAGGYGMRIELDRVPYAGEMREDYILFSQSNSRFVVTVPKGGRKEFERLMGKATYAMIGVVTKEGRLKIRGLDGKYVVDSDIDSLKSAWKKTLEGL